MCHLGITNNLTSLISCLSRVVVPDLSAWSDALRRLQSDNGHAQAVDPRYLFGLFRVVSVDAKRSRQNASHATPGRVGEAIAPGMIRHVAPALHRTV